MEYIHAIQMLPFTPISETLLSATWVTQEYPVLAPAAATAVQSWLGFIYMDHAVRLALRVLRRLTCAVGQRQVRARPQGEGPSY